MVEKHLLQPKWESIRETVANIVLGFVGRVIIITLIGPLLGVPLVLTGIVELSAILTVWSFIQHYVVRRHYAKKYASRVANTIKEKVEAKVKKRVKSGIKKALKKEEKKGQ